MLVLHGRPLRSSSPQMMFTLVDNHDTCSFQLLPTFATRRGYCKPWLCCWPSTTRYQLALIPWPSMDGTPTHHMDIPCYPCYPSSPSDPWPFQMAKTVWAGNRKKAHKLLSYFQKIPSCHSTRMCNASGAIQLLVRICEQIRLLQQVSWPYVFMLCPKTNKKWTGGELTGWHSLCVGKLVEIRIDVDTCLNWRCWKEVVVRCLQRWDTVLQARAPLMTSKLVLNGITQWMKGSILIANWHYF